MALRGLAVRAAVAATLLGAASASPVDDASFRVAEVKPHFACSDADGQDRVREYIQGLVSERFGVIGLLQTEFPLSQPAGYGAFGAACVFHFADSAVVMFDQGQFTLLEPLGATAVGNFSAMPYLSDGKAPTSGDSCLGDPSVDGERAYAGALLRHKSSGLKVCVISGTFPHFGRPLGSRFPKELVAACGETALLLVVDTNVDQAPMDAIGKMNGGGWKDCSDPGAAGDKTCCHDIMKGFPAPRFTYDRTALCGGGGSVDEFAVGSTFVCGANEEHRYTKALVTLQALAQAQVLV